MSTERTVEYAVRVRSTGAYVLTRRTRLEAESFVDSADDCEVVRITTTVEPVGLRWRAIDDEEWELDDGAEVVADVWLDTDDGGWCVTVTPWVERVAEYATLDEAKAAAEAAYRATWEQS